MTNLVERLRMRCHDCNSKSEVRELAANRIESLEQLCREMATAIEAFIDPEGNPPEDTGEWRDATLALAHFKELMGE